MNNNITTENINMANSMLEVSKLFSKMPKLAAQFSQNALALAAASNSNTYMNLLKGQFAASIASAAQNVYNSPSPSPPSIPSSSSSPSTSSSSSILSRIQPNLLPPPPPQSSSQGLQALNLLNSLRQAAAAASINHLPPPPPAPTSTIYPQPHLPHHVTPPPPTSELGQQQSPSKIYHCTQCQKLFFKFKHFKRHECEAATAKFTV